MRYQGFISYSHAADGKLAPAIHNGLHRIAKPWYRLRSMRVFRDKTSLSANPALWPTIQQALAESDYFLLLASPEAASSKWVQQEVAWWFENRSSDKLLFLLTGGDLVWDETARDFDWSRTTALPAIVRGRFANEPLWTDFRWARSANDLSLRHSQFRGAILDLAAPLLGRPKDEIDGEDVRQHRRLKIVTWLAMATILTFAVTAVWQALVARTQRNEAVVQRGRAEEQSKIATERRREAEEQRGLAETRQKEAERAGAAERAARIEEERQRLLAEERHQIAVSRQLATQADLVDRETSNVTIKSLLAVEAARRSQNGDAIEALTQSLAVLPRIRLRDRGEIFGMAVSPDGKRFAIGAQGRSPQPNLLRVFNVATAKPLYEVKLPSTPSSLVFTADNQRLIVGGFQLKVLDAATGRVLSEGDPKEREYAISQDGRFALSEGNLRRARVIDLVNQKDVAVLQGNDFVSGAAFSPDGRYVTTWSYGRKNASAIVFDASSGRELFRVAHESPDATQGVTAATFSSDNRYFASGSRDHTYVHSMPDGKQVSELPQGSWRVLRFTPDNESVATSPIFGGTLTIFSALRGSEQHTFPVGSVEKMAFSEDGELIAVGGDGVARILETETGRELARLKLGGDIHNLLISREGRWFAAGGKEGVQLADISNRRNPPLPCLGAEITDDGRRLLCLSLGTSMVFDTATGKPLVEPDDKSPMFAKLGNSGRYAVTTGIGAGFALVDARGNKVLWKTRGSDAPAMTFGPNDRLVAFSFDKTTHVVQPATGKEVARLDRSAKVLAQGFNQDESLLAISGEDKVVRIHDAFNGRERVRIPQDDRVHALAFAPGNLIATGSAVGSLRIFDALSGREVSHMPYAIPVMKLQFSRDGRYLLTLGVRPESESLAARIFDVATARELWATTLSREAFGSAASFADNDRAVVSYAAFQMQRHLWRAEDLIAEACARLDRNLTEAEWRQYPGDEPYRKTCPGR